MTIEIEPAIQFALAQTGKPYRAFGDRFGLSYFDCSGLVIRSLYEAGISLPPGISVAYEYGNTVSLYNWARDVGGLVSVPKAVATRGAILIKGRTYGNGPLGHTSISLGDGTEMAAHGTFTGIHPSPVYGGRNYQDGFIIPGVHYAALDPVIDPAVLAFLAECDAWFHRVSENPLHADKKGAVQAARPLDTQFAKYFLVKGAYLDPRFAVGAIYGKEMVKAVLRVKRRNGIHPFDGTHLGSQAAHALLFPA